ncbi:MAG: alpha-amylase family glycosyl hydrolase, partial [Bryobacteraceae bacterium]
MTRNGRRILAWALALAPAVAAVPVGAQPADEIRFGNAKIELRFDKATGRWLSLRNPADGTALMDDGGLASVLLTTDGRTTITTGRNHIWSLQDERTVGAGVKLTGSREQQEGDRRRLILQTEEGDWRIIQTYEMASDGDTVERSVSLTWNGPQETLLRHVDFRTPMSDATGDNLLEAPGVPSILHQRLARLPLGKWPLVENGVDREATLWSPGLLILRYPRVNALVWTFSMSIPSYPSVWRGDRGVWLNEELLAASRMKKGQTLEAGTMYIRLAPGDYMDALQHFQDFWNQAGVKLAGETPSWGRDARIYEVQVGPKGPVNPYPTVEALTADLDRIAALGFNVVQLMPHFPFPSYSVSDYMDVSTQYAPEAGLRAMIERAHALGLKVFLDVIMHGVVDKTLRPNAKYDVHPFLKEHPDWFVYTEDGRVSRTYTWALDQSNPGLQDYMVGVFRYYVG